MIPLPIYLIGTEKQHRVSQQETLLDIARNYRLGFNEIADLYPQLDPWCPPRGRVLRIPSAWIPPDAKQADIVINIAECRLYLFDRNGRATGTFPISIGGPESPTPEGDFIIKTKAYQPTWTVPPSLTHKYPFSSLPPGPGNPLGDYWLGLESHYGIHGTNSPWSIGRAVTNGCIRLYPEDIAGLFSLVSRGMRVQIVYEPIKFAWIQDRIIVEVHRDIYSKFHNFKQYGVQRLQQKGLTGLVSMPEYLRALDQKNGAIADVSLSPK